MLTELALSEKYYRCLPTVIESLGEQARSQIKFSLFLSILNLISTDIHVVSHKREINSYIRRDILECWKYDNKRRYTLA